MTEFEASNGVQVDHHDSRVDIKCSAGGHPDGHKLSVSETLGLCEFFQHERDEELGRWRWPAYPHIVVYRLLAERVFVLDEMDGHVREFTLTDTRVVDDRYLLIDAARAYFEAHPERKPWEDAQPGEVWKLTVDGIGLALVVDSFGEFQGLVTRSPRSASITAGHKIWPEDAS